MNSCVRSKSIKCHLIGCFFLFPLPYGKMAGGIEEPDGSKSNDSPSTINLTRIRERIRSYIDEVNTSCAIISKFDKNNQ